tara:strand:- start:1245 stop:1547 length:303 start_codon:yes stop_codon:yes gene_type:complete
MRIVKLFFLLTFLVLTNACMQSTAMLGPAITIGAKGNVYQAGFSYGSNKAIENYTGEPATKHVLNYIENSNDKKKRKKSFITLVENNFHKSRQKFLQSRN